MVNPQYPQPPVLPKAGMPAPQAQDIVSQAPTVSQAAIAPAPKPKTWTFAIPPSARMPGHDDPAKVRLRELSSDERVEASRLANGEKMRTTIESVKMSLYAVTYDGTAWKTPSHVDAEHEILWGKMSSKVQGLLIQGYGKIHYSDDREDEAFLGSMQPD